VVQANSRTGGRPRGRAGIVADGDAFRALRGAGPPVSRQRRFDGRTRGGDSGPAGAAAARKPDVRPEARLIHVRKAAIAIDLDSAGTVCCRRSARGRPCWLRARAPRPVRVPWIRELVAPWAGGGVAQQGGDSGSQVVALRRGSPKDEFRQSRGQEFEDIFPRSPDRRAPSCDSGKAISRFFLPGTAARKKPRRF